MGWTMLRRWKWRPTPDSLDAAVTRAMAMAEERASLAKKAAADDRARAQIDADVAQRWALGREMQQMAVRAWQRQGIAASRKYIWHIGMRAMPAAAAVAGGAAGGTLIGGLKGRAAAVVGIIAIVLAAVGAAGTALRPDDEFAYQGQRSRDLETIGWSLLTSINVDLAFTPLAELRTKLGRYQLQIATAVNRSMPDAVGAPGAAPGSVAPPHQHEAPT